MSGEAQYSGDSLPEVVQRLRALDRELAAPDVELRKIVNDILRTYPRRNGVIHLDLTDAEAIERRRLLRTQMDENNFKFGRARAERSRLIAPKRALTKGAEDQF